MSSTLPPTLTSTLVIRYLVKAFTNSSRAPNNPSLHCTSYAACISLLETLL